MKNLLIKTNKFNQVINISTSSQACISIESSTYESLKHKLPSSITVFPYNLAGSKRLLLVAASLNGGNVLDHFVDLVLNWSSQLGFIDKCDVQLKSLTWSKLIELSTEFLNSDSNPVCSPTLFAERHDKTSFASIHNICPGNTNVGQIFASICEGLIRNLHEMFPSELLVNTIGCKRIVATGGAIFNNPVLRTQLEKKYGCLPIVYRMAADSAVGAALHLRDQLKNNQI